MLALNPLGNNFINNFYNIPCRYMLVNIMKNIVDFSKESRARILSETNPMAQRRQKVEFLNTLRFRAFNHQPCCQVFMDTVSLEASFKFLSLIDLHFALNVLLKDGLIFAKGDERLLFAFSSRKFFQHDFSEMFLQRNVNSSFESTKDFVFLIYIMDDFQKSLWRKLVLEEIDAKNPILSLANSQKHKNRIVLHSKSSLTVNYYVSKFAVGRRLIMDGDFDGLISYGSKGWRFCVRLIKTELIQLCEELVLAVALFTPEDIDFGVDFSLFTSLEFIYHILQHTIYWSPGVVNICKELVRISSFWFPEHARNYITGCNLTWSMSWATKASEYLVRLQRLPLVEMELFSQHQLSVLLESFQIFQSKTPDMQIAQYHKEVVDNLLQILKPFYPDIQKKENLKLRSRKIDLNKDIDRYEYLADLGEGGHGQVFKSFDTLERRLVAVKKISCHESSNMDAAISEAKLLMVLDHPYIVKYHDCIQRGGNLFLVMEYCEGNNLSYFRKVWKSEKMKEEKIKIIGRQVLVGIAYLHAHHVIHRDIKPENIFLTGKGIIKIGDFGEAQICGHYEKKRFDLSSLYGTVPFMAPECLHEAKVTTSADIWSFGCLLIYLASGKRPWSQLEDNFTIMYHIATTDDIPELSSPNEVSSDLLEVLKSCFIRDPEKRPSAVSLLETPFFAGAKECLE